MGPFLLTLLFSVAPNVMVVGQNDVWYVGQENVKLDCRANANPPPHHFLWTRYRHQESCVYRRQEGLSHPSFYVRYLKGILSWQESKFGTFFIRLNMQMPAGVEMTISSLVFTRPLQRNDSGTYRCEVQNEVGLHSQEVHIWIHGELKLDFLCLPNITKIIILTYRYLFFFLFWTWE